MHAQYFALINFNLEFQIFTTAGCSLFLVLLVRDDDGDSVDVRVTDDQAERDDSSEGDGETV